ncbi:MAG: biopolymer transporter ExbD [Prevotellaceae bacterium]|jgi:biopolymer transport protein ExbD|nr:biopolymer transporter ExbD [Prevotellaceae bacterium]
MKIERRKLRTAEVYTASLNDIMFFLMLFFLIVSTMIAPATMRVVLPSSKTSTDAAVRNQVNLTVTSDLKYFIEDREVAYEQIESLLIAELAAKPETQETVVLLHADKSMSLQNVVNLFDIGNKLKIKMILFTQKEKT